MACTPIRWLSVFVCAGLAAVEDCSRWAAEGECRANPRYMLMQCRAACLDALERSPPRDARFECDAWAAAGECARNPGFMHIECSSACGQQWVWVPSARSALGLPTELEPYTPTSNSAALINVDDGSLVIDTYAAVHGIVDALARLVFHGQGQRLPASDGSVVVGVVSLYLYAARLLAANELILFAQSALVDDSRRVDWALRRIPAMIRSLDEIRVRRPPARVTVHASDRSSHDTKLVELVHSGISMPVVGLGTCWLSEAETEIAVSTVISYLRNHPHHPGVHIDSAEAYRNEAAIGRAIASKGSDRLFLASKLSSESLLTYRDARARVDETLRNFGVDSVHLYSLHSAFGFRQSEHHRRRLQAAWRALVDCYAEGKIKSLGLSNFDEAELRDFATDPKLGGFKMPDVLQNKYDLYHPGEQISRLGDGHPLDALYDFNMTLVAYSTLSGWPFGPCALHDPIVSQLANRRNITNAQLLLRWAIDMGHAVIPRSKSPSRIIENLDVAFLPPLHQHELDTLNSIARLVASPRNDPPVNTPDVFGVATAFDSLRTLREGGDDHRGGEHLEL